MYLKDLIELLSLLFSLQQSQGFSSIYRYLWLLMERLIFQCIPNISVVVQEHCLSVDEALDEVFVPRSLPGSQRIPVFQCLYFAKKELKKSYLPPLGLTGLYKLLLDFCYFFESDFYSIFMFNFWIINLFIWDICACQHSREVKMLSVFFPHSGVVFVFCIIFIIHPWGPPDIRMSRDQQEAGMKCVKEMWIWLIPDSPDLS